jgi:hypothetical protein
MNQKWQSLAREAGLAAEHMGIGVTALGKANYAQQAYYGQAFFALSIGIERAAKLALAVDHAVRRRGTFPSNKDMKAFGHDLIGLLNSVDAIVAGGHLRKEAAPLPRTQIHNAIVTVLSEFASNITRYYNLDVITDAPGIALRIDPIANWFCNVVLPSIALHVSKERLGRVVGNARLVERLMGRDTFVLQHSETGTPLTSLLNASVQTGLTKLAEPHVRLYVLQIVRFLSLVHSELGYKAQAAGITDVPNLGEFYAIYNNDDALLRTRRTWSIYRP